MDRRTRLRHPVGMDGGSAIIGFGEAASAFAAGWGPAVIVYDAKTDEAMTRDAKVREAQAVGVEIAFYNAAAVAGAAIVLSLVTADRALDAARETAASLAPDALYVDMNSVAPDTKRAAAALIEAVGGRYIDCAVMSPALPARRAAPLLVAGPHVETAVAALRALGFQAVTTVGTEVGAAAAVKMIRSVMVKGIEALSAECALAAHAAGVVGEVVASLDASWPGADWERRLDYNLDRMMVHGSRRAAEMEEVVSTLEPLGVRPALSTGTASRQREIGALGLEPPEGLVAKLALLAPLAVQQGKKRP